MPGVGQIRSLLDDLVCQGYAYTRTFLPDAVVADLRAEQLQLLDQNQIHPAGIGRGSQHQLNSAIRGDVISWLDPSRLSTAQQVYWDALNELRIALNRDLFLGLHTYECHYACYPVGGRYARHRDIFVGSQSQESRASRVISTVFYLNSCDWQPSDGGTLRLYNIPGTSCISPNAESYRDVTPQGGVFVLFQSHAVEHEVLPSNRSRYSLTGWFRTA